MSTRALTWAINDAPVPDPVSHLILIVLADYAHDDGTRAFPSQAKIAHKISASVRTVGYRLRKLEALGLIRRGDQSFVEQYRADRRPTVWDLNLRKVRNDLQEVQPVVPATGNDMHTSADGESHDLQDGAGRTPDDLQDLQAVDPNDLQGLQTVQVMEDNGLQTFADRSPHDLQGAAGRSSNDLHAVADKTKTYLTTSTNVDVAVVPNVSNSLGENGSQQNSNPESNTNITEIENLSSRDGVVGPLAPNDLQPHDVPGAWNPSPAAWAEAAAAVELVNLRLHLARYRVVKKEQGKPPSNGEWLRWVIADETEEQKKARKEAQASRKERKWYSVAD